MANLSLRRARWRLALGGIVALLLAAGVMTRPRAGAAARGYGGYGGGYSHCGRSCYARRCTKTCGQAKRTCAFCATQDRKEAVTQCVQARNAALTACAGNGGCRSDAKAIARSCTRQVKGSYRQARNHCNGLAGDCSGCCRSDYSASCTESFDGTEGFGSYLRTVHHYGRVFRYQPDCTGNGGGGGGGTGGGGGGTGGKKGG